MYVCACGFTPVCELVRKGDRVSLLGDPHLLAKMAGVEVVGHRKRSCFGGRMVNLLLFPILTSLFGH